MSNSKAFRPMINERKILIFFCYINLYRTMSPKGVTNLKPHFLEMLPTKFG